jgi:hypothetical protein
MSIKFDLLRAAGTTGQGREMIPVGELRAEIKSRLQEAHIRLNPRASFNSNAGADSMLGSMLLGALGFGGVADAMGGMVDMPDGFGADEQAMAIKALDALCEVRDSIADEKKSRVIKLSDYPEGRRKAFFGPERKKASTVFNLVSGNDNARFDMDATAEVSAMTEMMMILDKMDRQNIKQLRLEPAGDVYAALRRCA